MCIRDSYLRIDNSHAAPPARTIDQVCGIYESLIQTMREADFTDIFQMIDNARHLYVYGAGMLQSAVQKELKRVFLTANKIFFDINGPNEAQKMAGIIGEEVLVVIVSVSGESKVVLDFAKTLKIRNIPILSITKQNENTLARMSRHNLYVTTQTFNLFYGEIDYETVTSYFLLTELLFLKYVEYQEMKKEGGYEAGRTGRKKV